MRPLGLGFIGCGFVTRERHLPALRRVSEVRVVAVADIDPERASETAARFSVPATCASIEELLANPAVEAVAVCTPPATHVEVALTALDAGKHVLVEKPLALSLAEADRLVERAESTPAKAVVGFNFRRHRFVQQARRLIRNGALGCVLSMQTTFTSPTHDDQYAAGWRTRRSDGGGALFDRAIHEFDLWRYLLDDEVEEVFAVLRAGERDDEGATVTGRTRRGVIVSTTVLAESVVAHEVALYGTSGALYLDLCRFDGFRHAAGEDEPGSPGVRLKRLGQTLRHPGENARAIRRGGDYRLTYEDHWRRFAAIVEHDLPASPGVADGRAALGIVLAAVESGSTRQPVAVPPEMIRT